MKIIVTEQEKKEILTLYGLKTKSMMLEQVPTVGSPDEIIKNRERSKNEERNEYPNYCKYPEFTRNPKNTRVQGGATGTDLLIDGYCLYYQPSEGDIDFKGSGIWLPYTGDTRISFWDQSKRNTMYNNYIKYINSVGGKLSADDIKKQVDELYKDGMVHSFIVDNVLYKSSITYAPDYFRIAFGGFYVSKKPLSNDTKYRNPKWVDKRGNMSKFIDEYGMAIQLSVAALTVILAPFTAGSSLALLLEIGLELGVGIPVAIREYQRGDYVDSAFSTITSLLPMLKLTKTFTGISDETWESLSRYLKTAPPVTSNETKFAEWLSKMDIEDRKLLNELLTDNGYFLKKLLKKVETSMNGYLSVGLLDDIKIALKNNPTLSDKLKFWKTVGGRDLKRNLLVAGPSLLLQLIWGDKINAQDAGKLDGLWLEIPERYKPEFYENVANNPDKIPEIVNNEELNKSLKIKFKEYGEDYADDFIKGLNVLMRDTLKSDYIETGYDGTDGLPPTEMSQTEIDSLSNDGWYSIDDWNTNWEAIGQKNINGNLYFKK
jgi:hypothetical protein